MDYLLESLWEMIEVFILIYWDIKGTPSQQKEAFCF